MEMGQVRYFLALCKERNFTRAARLCGVAQPSVTNAIKALEAELGALLFDRRREGVALTRLGADVEPYFVLISRCVEQIKDARRSVSSTGKRPRRSRAS